MSDFYNRFVDFSVDDGLAPHLMLRNPIAEYQAQIRKVLKGEMIPEDEWVEPPPVVEGVDIRSNTTVYSDSDEITRVAVGGIVYDSYPDRDFPERIWYCVVDCHHGRIRYHNIPEAEIDFLIFSGQIQSNVLRNRRQQMAKESGKKYNTKHEATCKRLTAILGDAAA